MKPFAFFQAARTAQVFNVGLSFALAGIPVFGPATSFAQTPPPVYPEVGPTTHFVNQDTVLSGFSEPAWYKANVPFIDLPAQTIENVYYYRWRVAHEAQKYTGAKNGWIVTEFLGPVFYSAPYGEYPQPLAPYRRSTLDTRPALSR
jgi:hypothetical protein